MALVIMGGLLVSTFLTSVLLPTTDSLAEDGVNRVGRIIGKISDLLRNGRRRRGRVVSG